MTWPYSVRWNKPGRESQTAHGQVQNTLPRRRTFQRSPAWRWLQSTRMSASSRRHLLHLSSSRFVGTTHLLPAVLASRSPALGLDRGTWECRAAASRNEAAERATQAWSETELSTDSSREDNSVSSSSNTASSVFREIHDAGRLLRPQRWRVHACFACTSYSTRVKH